MTRRHRPYRLDGAKLFRALRAEAARKQNDRCYWCGIIMLRNVPQQHPRYLTGDHLIPRHAGGATKAGNIVAACRNCNSGRHPELERKKEARSLTVGDDTPRSPFEVLKKC